MFEERACSSAGLGQLLSNPVDAPMNVVESGDRFTGVVNQVLGFVRNQRITANTDASMASMVAVAAMTR